MQSDLQKAHKILLDLHLRNPLPLDFMNHFIGRQGAGFKVLINPCTYSLYPFTPFFSELEALAQTFLTADVKDVLKKKIRSTTVQGYGEEDIVKVTDDTLAKKKEISIPISTEVIPLHPLSTALETSKIAPKYDTYLEGLRRMRDVYRWGNFPLSFLRSKHTPFTLRAPEESSTAKKTTTRPKRILTPITPSESSKFKGYHYPYDHPPKNTDTIFRL
ncbi:MAG: hypothetical protein HEQ32_03355 [Vampirovibrio sp.]